MTYVIAEIGINHNGDMETARKLIDAAVMVGASAVKFQAFTPSLVAKEDSRLYEILKRTCLTKDQLRELKEHSDIDCFCSVFDLPSLTTVEELDFDIIKIPSGLILNYGFLDSVRVLGKKVILSTGMSNLADVEEALTHLDKNGVTILHCNSAYPTPMRDVNLRAMCRMKEIFNVPVGLSDHTLSIHVPVAAVALGAIVIEKHLTLNRMDEGPDHAASLEPEEFAQMIKGIRDIELALGDEVKHFTDSEAVNMYRRTI